MSNETGSNHVKKDLDDIQESLQSLKQKHFMEGDFICVSDKSKEKLGEISKDYMLNVKLVNLLPGGNYVSQLTPEDNKLLFGDQTSVEDYKILCICEKNKSDEIKEYLSKKYGSDINVCELNGQTVDCNRACNIFKSNIVSFDYHSKQLRWYEKIYEVYNFVSLTKESRTHRSVQCV